MLSFSKVIFECFEPHNRKPIHPHWSEGGSYLKTRANKTDATRMAEQHSGKGGELIL